MSRTTRKTSHHHIDGRRKHASPSDKVQSQNDSRKKWHRVALAVVFVLSAIPFIFGKYFEFNQPDPFDSGCYVYSAKHLLEGARLGVDELPSAQVGTLLLNMLGVRLFGFSETGPKIIQTILQAGAWLLMFLVLLRLFGLLPAAVGLILTSLYLSAPIIAKYGNVKEQYMISFMIAGVSLFVLYQLKGKPLLALLAGGCLSMAPLFKETGISAAAAVGLFVLAQPLLKHNNWKKAGTVLFLLLTGAICFIGPIYLWLSIEKAPSNYYPYSSLILKPAAVLLHGSEPQQQQADDTTAAIATEERSEGFLLKLMPGYVRDSWNALSPEQIKQAKLRVFRWYRVLILPIVLALSSIIIRLIKLVSTRGKKDKSAEPVVYDRFVLLFALWWLLDMTFVWISPRSYEQYYLPLNASAAMLGGYCIAAFCEKFGTATNKVLRFPAGVVGFIVMILLSQQIVFGVGKSPHSGTVYLDSSNMPEKRNGYVQRFDEISSRVHGSRGYWEVLAEYIKDNSNPDDGIYVWGWYPGIYVAAQRISPAPKAFEGTMHTLAPEELSDRVTQILDAFAKKPPKFIVDSRKWHFPWDRPPLELWPQTGSGFLSTDSETVEDFDSKYETILSEQIEPAEALRYQAMTPFRRYVMTNYKVVRSYGDHVLFQRK